MVSCGSMPSCGDGSGLWVGTVEMVTMWKDGATYVVSDSDARAVERAIICASYVGPAELSCPYGLSLSGSGEEIWYKTDGVYVSLIENGEYYKLDRDIKAILEKYAGK